MSLEPVARSKPRILVVANQKGGVGKTTTAAAIGLAGALSGKRTCVVTIDPARRLADALDTDSDMLLKGRAKGRP